MVGCLLPCLWSVCQMYQYKTGISKSVEKLLFNLCQRLWNIWWLLPAARAPLPTWTRVWPSRSTSPTRKIYIIHSFVYCHINVSQLVSIRCIPTKNVSLQSPWCPPMKTVTSMLTMSPSSKGLVCNMHQNQHFFCTHFTAGHSKA